MDGSEILKNSGKISAQFAKEFSESEFEKYRIIQDRLLESDFDRLVKSAVPVIEHGNQKKKPCSRIKLILEVSFKKIFMSN